jgi:hypothetical protein
MGDFSPEEIRIIVRTVLEEDAEAREKREAELQKRVLDSVLIMIGIDPYADPVQVSKDIKDFRATIAHSDQWRKSVNQIKKVGLATAVTTVTAGVLGAFWLGIVEKLPWHK